MSNELGIRMKVLRTTGRLTDALDDTDFPDQDEFQHLIVIPSSPIKDKCASCLRFVFFGLVITTVIAILTIVFKHHNDGTAILVSRPPMQVFNIIIDINILDA